MNQSTCMHYNHTKKAETCKSLPKIMFQGHFPYWKTSMFDVLDHRRTGRGGGQGEHVPPPPSSTRNIN